MLPQEWYENGKRLELVANRLAYYKAGLSRSPEYHLYAWRGIGDALREQGDMEGAAQALANEEKLRQGFNSTISEDLQESLSGIKNSPNLYKICPVCGADVPAIAQFCAQCGEPLSTGTVGRSMPPSQNLQGYQQGSQQRYQQGYQEGYQRRYQPSQANGFGTGGLIVAILGLIVAAIPLGIVAMVLGGIGTNKDRTKGLATAALCIGLIDILTGIVLVGMIFTF